MSVSDPSYRQDGGRQQTARTGGDKALAELSNRLAEARRAGDPVPEEIERLVGLLKQSGYEPGERLTSALEGLARWSGEAAAPAAPAAATPAPATGPSAYPQDRARTPSAAAQHRPPVPAELERRLADYAASLGRRPQAAAPVAAGPARAETPDARRQAAATRSEAPLPKPQAPLPKPQAAAVTPQAPAVTPQAPTIKPHMAAAAATPKPQIASLRTALAEIAARQKTLDAEPAPAPALRDEPKRWDYRGWTAPASGSARRDHRSWTPPASEPARPAPPRSALPINPFSSGVVGELRSEIDRLGSAVGELPTRAEIDGLMREMTELAGRIGADRPARLDSESLKAIDSLVTEVDRMRGDAASPQMIVDLANELHAISARLDDLGPRNSGAIDALARRIDGIRSELDQFPRAAAVDGVAAEIQSLIARLDAQERAAQPTREAVVGLSGRVEALDDRIAAIAQATIARDEALERANAAIRAELEDMPRAEAVNDLGRQIYALTDGFQSRSAIGPALKAVEGLSGRIEALDGKIDAMANRRGGEVEWFAEAVRDELAAVVRPEALDQLGRQIEQIASSVAAQRPEPIGGALNKLSGQIEGLGGRLESVASATRGRDSAFQRLEAFAANLAQRDGAISTNIVDAIGGRIDGLGRSLETVVAEARQRAAAFDRIEAVTSRLEAERPEPIGGAIEMLAGKIDGLGEVFVAEARERSGAFQRIEAATATLAAQRPEPIGGAIDALAGKIDGLGGRLDSVAAATRARDAAFGQLEAVAASIVERDGAMSAGIVDAIADRIGGLGDAVAYEARERAGAFERIEAITAQLAERRPEPIGGAIEELAGKIDSLGDRMETVAAATRARDAAMQQIEALTASLAARQGEPASEAVGAIAGRIDTLGDRMEAMAAATRARSLAFERVEESVRTIAEQLAAPPSGSAGVANTALHVEVGRVIENLERNDERIEDLHTAFAGLASRIERSCADLGAHCVESAVSAARKAIEAESGGGRLDQDIAQALDGLRASAAQNERRSADTLDAVRSTLGQLLDRMEDRAPFEARPAVPSGGVMSGPRIADAEPKLDATEAARAAARRALEEMAASEPQLPSRMPRVEAAPFENYADFAPDHPIEPGAAQPRLESAAQPRLETVAATEPRLDAGAAQPRLEPGAAQTAAAFIAAARRNASLTTADEATAFGAAETAANEAQSGAAPSVRLSGLIASLKSRGRPIALGVAAILIVCAALYVASGMTGEPEAIAPEPAASLEIAPAPSTYGPSPMAAAPEAEPIEAPSVRDEPEPAKEPPPVTEKKAEVAPPPAPVETAPPAKMAEAPAAKPEAVQAAPKAEAPQTGPKADSAPTAPATAASTAQIAPRAPAPDLTGFAFADAGSAASARAEWREGETVTTGSIDKTKGELPDRIGGPTLRSRAAAGDPSAQLEVGDRLLEGRNVEADPAAAAKWLEKAAAQGLAPAQHRLGSLYEKGRGVTRDVQAARRWYEQAAGSGNVRAMHNLGVVHAEGGLGKPDFNAAIVWFKMAAERGLVDSQYNLAVLCARGLGGKRDLVEAYKWFALAAQQGDQDAASKRDDVAKSLGGSLAAAKTVLEQFRPREVDEAANETPAPSGGWDQVADSNARPR